MTTVVLFATSAPHSLANDLMLAGCRVREALAISEVLALAEEHLDAHIVIAADVEPEWAKEISGGLRPCN